MYETPPRGYCDHDISLVLNGLGLSFRNVLVSAEILLNHVRNVDF